MDTIRARQIMQAKETIQVLYQDSPVWIENVKENNTAVVRRMGTGENDKLDVPVYLLVENRPV